MKRVSLPFDRKSIEVDLPDSAVVISPKPTDPLPNPEAAIRQSLHAPIGGGLALGAQVRAGQRVAIVISDITRPVPNQIIVPPLISELTSAGIKDEDIVIVVGNGLHRLTTPDELEWMLGSEMVQHYRIVQHEARRSETLVEVGKTSAGIPVQLCRAYVEADFRIVTGFVEPHLFAGYSGGAKGVMPGLAGADLIMHNHGYPHLSDPHSRWFVTEGNPVFSEINEITSLCPPDFLLNVTLDTWKQLTGVFSGEPSAAHRAAISQAESQYLVEIADTFDVVIVTNMGYPADTTLYQCVKGMSAAAEAVCDGGAIVLVAGCVEGIGGAEYVSLLASGQSPATLLADIAAADAVRLDQWQVQCQAEIQARAAVYLHSNLTRTETEGSHLNYCSDVSEQVAQLIADARARGRDGSVLVLPYGQLTVPVVAK